MGEGGHFDWCLWTTVWHGTSSFNPPVLSRVECVLMGTPVARG